MTAETVATTGSPPGGDTMTALLETVAACWPQTGVSLVCREQTLGGATAAFLVVPDARSPRLLVPADDPRAAARALRRFSTSLSWGDTARRTAASSAVRVTGGRLLADRVLVSGGSRTPDSDAGRSLVDHLGDVLGGPVTVSLGIGTARANRKPVLQVFDSRGRTSAFVKVGDTALSRADVGAEAAALRRLAGARLPGIEVPRLIADDDWNGMRVVVMSALRTTAWQRPRGQWRVPVREMDRLHSALGTTRAPFSESELHLRLAEACAGLRSTDPRERFAEALQALDEVCGTRVLTLGAWHGDWTPWNMARRRDRLQLWDWERFATGVPAGLDRCHYGVNTVCRRDGLSPASVRRGLELAGEPGGRHAPGESPVAGIYLATIAARYLASAEAELGERIAERAATMVDCLRLWLGLADDRSGGPHGHP